MQRVKRVPVYVTDEELQAIRVAAARAGKSMSEWARDVVLQAAMQYVQMHRKEEDAE